MAWSPQARAAAIAARRRKGHGSATKHIGAKYTPKASKRSKQVKYTLTAKHPTTKPVQFHAKAKKAAKYTAIAAGVGVAAYSASKTDAYSSHLQNKSQMHQTKANLSRKASRFSPQDQRISKHLSRNAMYHQKQATKLQKRVAKRSKVAY